MVSNLMPTENKEESYGITYAFIKKKKERERERKKEKKRTPECYISQYLAA